MAKIWEQPVTEVLAAGVEVLPLAPVAAVEPEQLPGVLMAISERLIRDTTTEDAATLWAATKVLMGLRYSKDQVDELTRGASAMILGVRGIEESSVYQDIFAQGEARGKAEGKAEGEAAGRVEEARIAVLRVGRKKYGEPDAFVASTIGAIDDVDRLNLLLERILEMASWHDLLILPDSTV